MSPMLAEALERAAVNCSKRHASRWEDVEVVLASWRAMRETLYEVADDSEFSCMPSELQERVLGFIREDLM